MAFVGLGVMGYPMAGHLAAAGHAVRVYNRTETRAKAWVAEHGGTGAPTPAAAAAGADLVFVCVGNDDDVRSVTLAQDGVLERIPAGAVLVHHTTASVGARMPLTALVDQFYADVAAMGGARWDTSSLIERLRRVEETGG